MSTAQSGSAYYTGLLLEACADPDIDDGHGATPLFMAAQGGHVSVVARLIEGCADISVARHESMDWFTFGSRGMTALMKAREKIMVGDPHMKRQYMEVESLLEREQDSGTGRTCECNFAPIRLANLLHKMTQSNDSHTSEM